MKKLYKLSSLLIALSIFLAPSGLISKIEAGAAAGKWTAAWGTSIVNGNIKLGGVKIQDVIPAKSTLRIELQVTTGGEKLKFKLSNEYGKDLLTINEATVAKTTKSGKAAINAASAVPITFYGKKYVNIPAGSSMWSDEVKIKTSALEKLSLSLYFEKSVKAASTGLANARTFLSRRPFLGVSKSQTSASKLFAPTEMNIGSGSITYHITPFLSEIDSFSTEPSACSAVFIGDSTLVNDAYLYYAERLVNSGVKNVGVINEAVIGNKLMSDGTGTIGNLYGKSLLKRFEADALSATGVKYIFVKIGLNDVLHQFSKTLGKDTPKYSPDDIIGGYKTLVQKAHAKGIKIYFFTKSAFKGYERSFLGQKSDLAWNKTMQKMCDELDDWVRTNAVADGYIDCVPLRNPADEYALCPSFTPDGAHLTSLGSVALADLIPLSFVGANPINIKTAAELHGIDPYAEKKQIAYDLEHPTKPTEPTKPAKPTKPDSSSERSKPPESSKSPESPKPTKPPEPVERSEPTKPALPNTAAAPVTPEIPTTAAAPASPTLPPEQPAALEPNSDADAVSPTLAVVSPNTPPALEANIPVNPDYKILDSEPVKIGSGVNIGFLLGLFMTVVLSGVALTLALGKKREEKY